MVVILWLQYCFGISECFSRRKYTTRLFPSPWSVHDLRVDSAAFHLLQLVYADDPSAHIAGAGARHEQLRQRVGEALARARKRQRAVAAAWSYFESCGARARHPLQVLHSGSNNGAGKTSCMDAHDSRDEGRSKPAVLMAPV